MVHLDIGSAHALARVDVTVVVVRSTGIAVTRLTAKWIGLRQAIMLVSALVTVSSSGNVSFAGAVAGGLVTASIGRLDCAVFVTCALLASIRVFSCEVPIPWVDCQSICL